MSTNATIPQPSAAQLSAALQASDKVVFQPTAPPEPGQAKTTLAKAIEGIEKQIAGNEIPEGAVADVKGALDNATAELVNFKDGDKEERLTAAYLSLMAALQGAANRANDALKAKDFAEEAAATATETAAPVEGQVMMIFPKPMKLVITPTEIIDFQQGMYAVDAKYADHDYLKRNGARRAQPADIPASVAAASVTQPGTAPKTAQVEKK